MNIKLTRLLQGIAVSFFGILIVSGAALIPHRAEAAITVFDQEINNNDYGLPGIKKPYPFPAWTSQPLFCFPGSCTPPSAPAGMATNFNIRLAIDKAGAGAHATNNDSLSWFDYPVNGTQPLPLFSWNVHAGSDTNQAANKTGGEVCKIIDSTSVATWTTSSYNSPQNNKLIRYGQVAPGNVWQIANADDIGNSYIKKLTCTTSALPANTLSASPTTITSGQSSTITFDAGPNNEAQSTICTPVNFTIPTHERYVFGSVVLVGGLAAFGGPDPTTYQYVGAHTGIQDPDTSGSVVVSPTVTTTYQYNCTNGNGTTPRSVTVTVLPVVPPAATVSSFTAAPTSIASGGSSTLTWSSANATSCTSGNFATGGLTSGSVSVSPTTTTTYSLSCTGAGGTSAMSYATVTVTGTKDLVAGSVTPTAAVNGTAVTLSSTISNNGSAATGAGFTNLFQRATSASGTGSTDIGTHSSGALAASGTGAATLSYTFPTAGTWYVRVCADSTGAIAESNESNNCSAWTAVTVSAAAAPNLTVGAVSPTSVVAGSAVTLSAAATNSGTGATSNTYVVVFQTATSAAGAGAASIGTYVVPVQAAGASNAATLSYTFPSVGTTYARICADTQSAVTETDEGDNCGAWLPISVTAATAPNLTAGTVTPTAATNGTAVTLSSTISNNGSAATGAGFTNLFQRATDASGTGSTDIGTHTSGALAASGTGAATLSYTFPSVGTWYVRACADKNSAAGVGTIPESNESDNCSSWTAMTVTAATAPNLTAGTVTPTAATNGTAVTLSATVTNSGTASTGTTFTDNFQRATDASGTGAVSIGTYVNPIRTAGTSNAATLSYTFPSVGTWYVRVCADNNASMVGTIGESNESDNCGAWTAVTVSAAAAPNLTVGAVSPTSVVAGSAVTLSAAATNSGTGATSNTYVVVFQTATSAAGAGAASIGTYVVPVQAAGASNAATLSYTFPSVGTTYARICADTQSAVTETDEGDNCGAWLPISVTAATAPNLTAGTVTPTAATNGTAVTLSATVTNSGTASTGTTFTDNFQRATDASGTGAVSIGTYVNPIRTAGTSNAATLSYTFPSVGTWYVRVCADNNASMVGTIGESNESDNCGAWTAVTVSAPLMPDLTAGTVTPTAATNGTAVTLSATVTNSGTASTGTTFTDNFQRATDASGTGAVSIGTYVNPIRTAGTSNAATLSYTFPSVGTWYVRVCADNNASSVGTIAESNEGNNCGAWTAVTVSAPLMPELSAGSITPTAAVAGTAVTLSSTVSNSGTASTGTTFTDVFQVANDASGTGATVIGTFTNPVRAAGTSGAATLSYTFTSAGTKYVRACADQNASFVGTIAESNEGNNCGAWTAVTVTIANLTPGAVTPTAATVGVAVTLSSTISNTGNASTGTTFLDLLQVANDASGNGVVSIGTYTHPVIAAGGSSPATVSYTFTSAGTKYARFCTDTGYVITESDDGDNCGAWTAVTVTGPNLTAGSVTPTSATMGSAVTLSAIVTNNGSSSTGGVFLDLFQVANDALGTGAVSIGTFSNPVRAAGTTNPATLSYTFTSIGTKYVRVCADSGSAIGESNEGDNCGAWTLVNVVGVGTGIDLTAGTINQSTAVVNVATTFTATVSNAGTDTTGTTFTDNFQVANDAAGSGAVSIGTFANPVTAGGSASTASRSYTFTSTGVKYMRVCADNNASMVGTITEINEGNNCGPWRAIAINNPVGAGVTSCTVSPGSVATGTPVTWTASPSGLGTYVWAPSEGGAPGGTGVTLNRTYNTAGTYGMSVTAGGGTVNCPNVIVGASLYGTAEPTITTSPERVVPGGTTQITVSATGVDSSCTLAGPGVSQTFTAVAGVVSATNVSTAAINNQSTYTFTCDDVEATAKAIVNIIPVIQEF